MTNRIPELCQLPLPSMQQKQQELLGRAPTGALLMLFCYTAQHLDDEYNARDQVDEKGALVDVELRNGAPIHNQSLPQVVLADEAGVEAHCQGHGKDDRCRASSSSSSSSSSSETVYTGLWQRLISQA